MKRRLPRYSGHMFSPLLWDPAPLTSHPGTSYLFTRWLASPFILSCSPLYAPLCFGSEPFDLCHNSQWVYSLFWCFLC